MPYAFPPDLQKLIEDRMLEGNYASEDDLLRDALAHLADIQDAEARHDELLKRIGISQSQVKEGRVRPLDTAATIAEARRRRTNEACTTLPRH